MLLVICKLLLKVTGKQQKEYFDIFEVQFSLGFIIVQGGNLCWLVSLIQIGPSILMIRSLLQVMFSVWDLDLSLGLVRNNKHFLFLQQKQNIEPQLMSVSKLYGFDRSFHSLDSSSSNLLHFGATINVPSNLPKIQFYISATNKLSYRCTSSETLFMIEFLKCSFSLQMIKLQTSSLSLLQKRSFLNFGLCLEFRNVSLRGDSL